METIFGRRLRLDPEIVACFLEQSLLSKVSSNVPLDLSRLTRDFFTSTSSDVGSLLGRSEPRSFFERQNDYARYIGKTSTSVHAPSGPVTTERIIETAHGNIVQRETTLNPDAPVRFVVQGQYLDFTSNPGRIHLDVPAYANPSERFLGMVEFDVADGVSLGLGAGLETYLQSRAGPGAAPERKVMPHVGIELKW